jgi:hypothetical protein
MMEVIMNDEYFERRDDADDSGRAFLQAIIDTTSPDDAKVTFPVGYFTLRGPLYFPRIQSIDPGNV